ncbi:MAG: outer membrane protein TolC [Bradymonadia bacterium]|jgi:outer membrane protein TolC
MVLSIQLFALVGASNAAAQTLSLEAALDRVASESFAVRRVELLAVRAELLDAQAGAAWRTSVDAVAAYTFFDEEQSLTIPDFYGPILPYLGAVAASDPRLPALEDQLGEPVGPAVTRNQHDLRASVVVSQPLYQGFSRALRVQADAVREEAGAVRSEAIWSVQEVVLDLYFAALRQQRYIEVTERARALAELNVTRLRVATEAEVAGEFELNRAEVALAAAGRDAASAVAAHTITIDALAELLQLDPDFDVEAPTAPDPMAGDAARPDARRLAASIQRTLLGADLVRAERLPTVGLEGSLTGMRETAFSDPIEWHIRVGLSWSLYDGGQRRVEEQRIELEASELELELLEAEQRALAEERRQQTRIQIAQLNLEQASLESTFAERNVDVTHLAWQAGAASFLDVETARQQRLLAELAVADAEVSVAAARWESRRLRGEL